MDGGLGGAELLGGSTCHSPYSKKIYTPCLNLFFCISICVGNYIVQCYLLTPHSSLSRSSFLILPPSSSFFTPCFFLSSSLVTFNPPPSHPFSSRLYFSFPPFYFSPVFHLLLLFLLLFLFFFLLFMIAFPLPPPHLPQGRRLVRPTVAWIMNWSSLFLFEHLLKN